jgi:hypothetical protein
MPYLFYENTDCRYHEEFDYILLEQRGEWFEENYEELVVGMNGKKRPFPKRCRRCGCKIVAKCPKCEKQLNYWPPQRCEGCGLDFNSINCDEPKRLPQLPGGA